MKYRYSGPTSGVTLLVDGTAMEVMLFTGAEVELPETHEYTKTLLALKHLTPLGSSKPSVKTPARANTNETAAKGA